MTESMIERCAKALCEHGGVVWLKLNQAQKAHHMALARAVIRAMREPTDLMLEAGFESSPHDVGGCRDQIQTDEEWMQEAVVAPYQAMIDAALKWPAKD